MRCFEFSYFLFATARAGVSCSNFSSSLFLIVRGYSQDQSRISSRTNVDLIGRYSSKDIKEADPLHPSAGTMMPSEIYPL